jgi:hypothetical protein
MVFLLFNERKKAQPKPARPLLKVMLMKLEATEVAQVENRFRFTPAVKIAAFTAVRTALGAEKADVIAGGTAKNPKVDGLAALHADGLGFVDTLFW